MHRYAAARASASALGGSSGIWRAIERDRVRPGAARGVPMQSGGDEASGDAASFAVNANDAQPRLPTASRPPSVGDSRGDRGVSPGESA